MSANRGGGDFLTHTVDLIETRRYRALRSGIIDSINMRKIGRRSYTRLKISFLQLAEKFIRMYASVLQTTA